MEAVCTLRQLLFYILILVSLQNINLLLYNILHRKF